jgi:short-subunit dehydrogenase
MARIWAADGRDLVLCARRLPKLEALRDELLAAHPGRTILVRELDVTDHVAVDRVFTEVAAELGGLDRVVANAGVMSPGPVGAGHAAPNRAAAETNFFGVLHQAEAALVVFRAAGAGHLVLMSSVAGLRGMGGRMNVYSATKAAVATLAEGIRSDLWHSPITVSTIMPGYIATDLIAGDKHVKWMVDLETGSRALVAAIEREPARAYVPRRPWALFSWPMRLLPMAVFRRGAGY